MENSNGGASLASIQAAITALSVQAGRADERLVNIASALTHHMQEEHKSFNDALAKINSLEDAVGEIHSVAKVTRMLAAVIAGLAGAAAWALDWFRVKP